MAKNGLFNQNVSASLTRYGSIQIRVYDTDLNFADCAIWGSGVDAVYAGDASVPMWNDVSNADEISADNCVVF